MGSDGTRADVFDARALLEAWRESGADRLAPARFQLMDAMARRSAACAGEARQRLDERLAALIQGYQSELDRAMPSPDPETVEAAMPAVPPPTGATRGPLGTLADSLAAPTQADAGLPPELDLRAAYPELPVLEYFRGVWSSVSADRQVRQSQEQVHKNAGPLNSNQLVHRTLSLMRELSPGYLQQFLSYTDALMWMEQMSAATAPPAKEAPRAGAKKTTRAKAR